MEGSKYESYKTVQPLEKSRRGLPQGKLSVSAHHKSASGSMNSSLLGLADRSSGSGPRRPVHPQCVQQSPGESTTLSLSDVDSPSPHHTPPPVTSSTDEDSLVRVTRHHYEEEVFDTDPALIAPLEISPSENWRRFTSNFAPPNNQKIEQSKETFAWSVHKGGGVSRSQSDHVMENSPQEQIVQSSVLSQSVNLGAEKLTSSKKPPKSRTVASRYLAESNRKPLPGRVRATPSTTTKAAPIKASLTTGKKIRPGAKAKGQRDSQNSRASTARKPPSTVGKTPHSASRVIHRTPVNSKHSVSFSSSGLTASTPIPRHGTDGSFLSSEPGEKSPSAQEVEYLQCRLLQATAMNTLSAESVRLQDLQAKNQLFRLWSAVEGKREESHKLRLALETEQHDLALDKTLAIQQQALGPLVDTLPILERCYNAMSQAVDTTRHHVTLQGISPVTEKEFSEQLLESEVLLGEVMTIIRPEAEHVSLFAESVESVTSSLQLEELELNKCAELLGTVAKLQLHETSLFLGQRHSNTAHNF